MLPELKEYFDRSTANEISLVSFMKRFPDIHDKDRILSIWTGALGYFQQHSSSEKRQLYASLRKYTSLELERIIDKELQEGNLILTDGHYKILSILRVGETYDISALTRNFEPISRDHLVDVLKAAGPKDILKKILNTKLFYGPALTEHAILKAELSPNVVVSTGFDTSEGSPHVGALFAALQDADKIIEMGGNNDRKGYIIMLKHKKKNDDDPDEKELITYDEFHPYLFAQHELQTFKEFESFDASVDEFFSAAESQRLEVKKRAQEEQAQKKLDSVRLEHFSRVRGLEEAQQLNVLKAALIEANLEMCDQAVMIIRNAVATGMDWKDLADLVDDEKRRNNPIALMIDSLKLETNNVCVILSDPYDEEFGEGEQDDDQEAEDRYQPKAKSTILVDLDISLTAFANARKYYDVRKQSAIKQERTLAHASKAFKSAEKKIRQQLQEVRITTSIQRARKPYWFEKFMWFITSENYLVIAGRDAQQNEMIVKRYMKKNDIYVHADNHGAATVVVKNPSDTNPIPASSIYQAGIMSVCQSRAWDDKIVISAYWVRANQVSKSAPTGEYLTTGSFMIRGKKNFLPPVQLVYGFGFLFKLDDSSIANHLNERRPPMVEDADTSNASASTETAQANTVTSSRAEEPDINLKVWDNADEQNDDEQVLEGSDDSEDEKQISENDDATQEDAKDEQQAFQDQEDEKSDSEEESEAVESSDEEFPDTQIQFNTSAVKTDKEQQVMADPAVDKYGLQDYGDDSEEEKADYGSSSGQTQKQKTASGSASGYITAKMRRDMKKGKTPGQSGNDNEASPPTPKQGSSKKPQQGDSKKGGAGTTTATPTLVRGKKGKTRKIKERYADQDEEERQLRLELLAPDKGPQLKGKRAKKEAEKKAEKAALEEKKRLQQQEYLKSKGAKGGNKGDRKEKRPAQESMDAEGGGGGGGGGGEEPQDKADADLALVDDKANENEREEVRRLLQEENIRMLEPEETENLTVLDGLTGKPVATDILQFAVPVCAPYGALQKYKYKVKLIPGTMKKGKSVKAVVNYFLAMAGGQGSSESETRTVNGLTGKELQEAEAALEVRERELIKMVKDEEAINAMIGKTKVSGVEGSGKKTTGGGRGRR
ncbi:hypothetical protein BGZ65_010109 [Modicella reniformis]|uniref:NFACT RNA-binding domain-containing protein n=1 Tax=Modicella reniformis TaxID=1440133 RepID=A0A9P6SUX1_9FUNG|nr:hypothetical protein BGZ65_010109 [Modicella reniformis]